MLAGLMKLGISGGVGVLVGVVLVVWVQPTTSGGVGILVVLSVIICMMISGVVSKVAGKKDKRLYDD